MINRGCVKIRLSPFCRGVACIMNRCEKPPLEPEWWGSVGAQHATPCVVRRIMNPCPSFTTGGAPLAPLVAKQTSPLKGGNRLNPTYWMGWVFLAQGSTLGHGAPRHQRRASVICILPHIAPTGRRALSAAACYALRRKAHNESTRKVMLYFDTPSSSQVLEAKGLD